MGAHRWTRSHPRKTPHMVALGRLNAILTDVDHKRIRMTDTTARSARVHGPTIHGAWVHVQDDVPSVRRVRTIKSWVVDRRSRSNNPNRSRTRGCTRFYGVFEGMLWIRNVRIWQYMKGYANMLDRTKYVLWDAIHPTEKLYRIVADNALQVIFSHMF
ncbi:hypothetical protein DH2020_042442 [Rehmannia glutinosa]|uniref:GDSL esterase/lipase n=1 Tax=Rehmannia glutinosa TaxID=99300 RepID=A0ABR0UNC7_REHGL